MKSQLDKLNEAYGKLVSQGKFRTQKDFATEIGFNEKNLSSAFNGDKRYLTDGLFERICNKYPELFNIDYFLDKEDESKVAVKKAIAFLKNTYQGHYGTPYGIFQNTGIPESLILKYRDGLDEPTLNNAYKLNNYFEGIEDKLSVKKDDDNQYSINKKGKGVPYYDVDFIGGFDLVANCQNNTPTHYIDFPQYANAHLWVNVTGKSMEPLINHGDIIAVRNIEDWNTYILYGEVYGIVTDEYRTIKYVRTSKKGDGYFRLVPENKEFDEQDIPKSIVRAVYQIIGCAKRL